MATIMVLALSSAPCLELFSAAPRNNKQTNKFYHESHMEKDLLSVWVTFCPMLSIYLMSGSCHLDRASNDEFSVECLF